MNGEIHRAAEFSGVFARSAKTAQILTIQAEYLNAPVSRIRHKNLITGDGDPRRVIELPLPIALAAPGGHKLIRRLCG